MILSPREEGRQQEEQLGQADMTEKDKGGGWNIQSGDRPPSTLETTGGGGISGEAGFREKPS